MADSAAGPRRSAVNSLNPAAAPHAPAALQRRYGVLASLRTAAVFGVEACPVHVEVDVSFGLPSFTMVGLPDASVRESRDRVRSAIRNSGFEFPPHRITVNLAPADVRKAGSSFDLPIALGILAASGHRRAARRLPISCCLASCRSTDRSTRPAACCRLRRRRGASALTRHSAAGCQRRRSGVSSGSLRVLPVVRRSPSRRGAECPGFGFRRPSCRRVCSRYRARRAGPRGRPRPAARAARARNRVRRRPQPAPRRTAGCRQDDDGAACCRDPAAAVVRRGARSDLGPFGRRAAAARLRAAPRTAVPRSAPHDFECRAGRRRRAAAAR